MSPKINDGSNGRKNRSLPKYRERGRSKKLEKNRLSTNIPLPVPLMRSQSLVRKGKTESSIKKPKNETEGNKITRSRSTSNKRKEPGLIVLERIANVSKKNISIPANSSSKLKIPSIKTSEGDKLKGFNEILPLCEKELRKIEDAWLCAAYCSLSMRANLFKFLSQSFPNIDRDQFYTEDRKLVKYFQQLKNSNKTETQNLMNIIKSVLANREKTKDECNNMYKSEKCLRKKITQTKEENKNLKTVTYIEPPSKNDEAEQTDTEKPQITENSHKKKEAPILSFFTVGNHQNSQKANGQHPPGKQNEKTLKGHHAPSSPTKQTERSSKPITSTTPAKQTDNPSKTSPLPNVEEHKLENIKSLTIKKDFEALKSDFLTENETLEKKVRELENVLEEKIKKLKSEKEMKDHLNSSLTQFHSQKNTISLSNGFEHLECILGPPSESRDKWRRELWLTAIRLILSGFFVQLRNLETERNKMLYQLQTNDIDNFNAFVVSIIRKQNFIKSIRHQMKSLNDAYQSRKNKENEVDVKETEEMM